MCRRQIGQPATSHVVRRQPLDGLQVKLEEIAMRVGRGLDVVRDRGFRQQLIDDAGGVDGVGQNSPDVIAEQSWVRFGRGHFGQCTDRGERGAHFVRGLDGDSAQRA